jgi:hypothetical protein
VLAGLALAAAAGSRRTAAAGAEVAADQVRAAIRQGAEYLLKEQSARGAWNEMTGYPGGVTGLCTLALLNAGVEPSHPQIQRALAYLRGLKLDKTYSIALQTMALCAAEPQRDLALIQQNVAWLEKTQVTQGDRVGGWSYPQNIGGDNSNSQFAVLALHDAERVGARVDPQTWQRAASYWKECQNPDGSWGYQPGWEGLGSMTCAGIGATVICAGRVAQPRAKVEGEQPLCCLPREDDDALDRAVAWLARNFSVQRNPGGLRQGYQWHYYYLYGLERVGRLTARRFVGEHDWYREGAEYLIAQQDAFSRHWVGAGHAEDDPHIATALALLFLSKGRWPVLAAKLRHGADDDWNRHPSDLANLVGRLERQWGLNLTWQTIDPLPATADDLLQAPVLFLSGSQTPALDGAEQKLRAYLDRGGFLFAEACCLGGGDFEQGVRRLLQRVFPEEEYRLRRAGPEHPVWRIDELVRPESPYVGRLWTVEYGCRTCVVFCEVDLSCYWELYGGGRIDAYPPAVQQRIGDAMALGANVLAYATNREPKAKEAAFGTNEQADVEVLGSRGVIRLAQLVHGGGCNDAPGALANLLRAAAQGELKLRVSTAPRPIAPDDDDLARFHLAFAHGRHEFQFTPQQRDRLRNFLENGGTLFADAICASKPFAEAFRREVAAMFPDRPLTRIPIEHPLFSERPGGFDLRRVRRREPAAAIAGQPLRGRVQEVEPELEGMEIDGRLAVIFSPYDVSCALEQHEALQCRGYAREDAARLALNVLMYSLNPDVP